MDHSELVAEMPQVEQLSTHDRLNLARIRRAQQLKIAKQREKEWQKMQNRKDRSTAITNNYNMKGHICFDDSIVLLEAAARNDIGEVARLLQKGVNADVTNMDGLTALHQCCIDDNAEMLRLLLDYGADVNAQDSEKWTPLHAAATCSNLNLVKILISRGANLLAVNLDANFPYDICDDEETLDYIESEMSKAGITQELIDETRAATETKMLKDLQEMSNKGEDLEIPDKNGATPLHIAAANGYTRVAEFLLEQNVSLNVTDLDLWTPIHAASCWGHIEILELLANHGADLNAQNKNNETPADICEDPEIRERIEILKSEQETKRLAEAQRKRVRRSQSNNTRAQSVRRTSLRDKTLTTKKDAVEETRLRLQAQEGYTTNGTTSSHSFTSEKSNGSSVRPLKLSNVNFSNTSNSKIHNPLYGTNISYPISPATVNNPATNSSTSPSTNRQTPEGRDNDDIINEIKTHNDTNLIHVQQKKQNVDFPEVYSTTNTENGKINVQVTVLFEQSVTGTLADLKKHRSQSRSSTSPENCSILSTQSSMAPVELAVISQMRTDQPTVKFSGNTSDVINDSTKSHRCCVIM